MKGIPDRLVTDVITGEIFVLYFTRNKGHYTVGVDPKIGSDF